MSISSGTYHIHSRFPLKIGDTELDMHRQINGYAGAYIDREFANAYPLEDSIMAWSVEKLDNGKYRLCQLNHRADGQIFPAGILTNVVGWMLDPSFPGEEWSLVHHSDSDKYSIESSAAGKWWSIVTNMQGIVSVFANPISSSPGDGELYMFVPVEEDKTSAAKR